MSFVRKIVCFLVDNPPRALVLLSAGTLLTAYIFQYGFGYQPCDLCYYQRYPYFAVILIGLVLMMLQKGNQKSGAVTFLFGLMVLALFLNAGMAGFHVGVEQHWWEGPTSCSSAIMSGLSIDDQLAALKAAPIVRCDVPAWTLFGISMAGYNILIALGLASFGVWGKKTGRI